MDTNNKPEVTADPAATQPVISSEEALHQRIQEVREQQTPITPAELVDGVVAKPSGGQPDVDGAQESSSNGNDANVAALKLIEASTGRKFNSTEDAQKFLVNLNSLVGDQSLAKSREAAKTLDALSTKLGKPVSELSTYVDTLVASVSAKPDARPASTQSAFDSKLSEKVERLEDFEQRLQLERKYPQAVEVVEEISLVAKAKGVSYIEAFEKSQFKELLELKAKEEQARNPVVTPSNKTKINTQSVAELGQKLMTGKGREADAVRFIEELGLGQ